ncbi:MAG: TAXI family TRAP transporter solute-binding subunit [Bacillota bacterium]
MLRRNGLIFVAVLVLCAILLSACGKSSQTLITIATGGTAGTYYPLGGAMAEIFNEKVKGVSASATSTGASVANVRAIEAGEFQLGLVQNDIAYYAYNGLEMFKDGKLTGFAGIACLYPETIQIITLANRNINTVADLRGKRVAVGASGSGTEANARQILAAYGLTYADLGKTDYLSFGEAAANLKDGHIDAAFITAGVPTAAVQEIASTHQIKVIPVPKDYADKLRKDYPFYTTVTIPAGTYRGLDRDVETVAVQAMLVTTTKLDKKTVYELTKALFENLDRMGAAHARGKDISLDKAKDGMSIPLHAGAEQYFKEKGK